MVGLFERLFGRSNQDTKSGKQAKDRLQFVLVQDRIDMSSEKMEQMQKEIIAVISKYVTVDMENVDFALRNRERDGLLVAEIPFRPPKDESKLVDDVDTLPEPEKDINISVEEATASPVASTNTKEEKTEDLTIGLKGEGSEADQQDNTDEPASDEKTD